ncbi:MAG: MBL fold metallo-hydrolase [Candidatus Acidiferrales bacterium]
MTQALIHEIIPVGMLQCNCSILGDPQTREALVIDPGDDVDQILALLARHQLKVRAIASTHTHIDHVGGLARLHQVTGAPVLIHESDMELYRNLARQAQWLGVPVPALTTIESFLRDGDTLRWGHFQARVLHTPGHTPGSISLWIPDTRPAGRAAAPASTPGAGATNTTAAAHAADLRTPEHKAPRLIAGDTLFAGSIGRTDLWGGSFPDIIRSIREKLLVLPEETLVIPGHGGSTTIGEEKQSNPFLTARAT